MKVITNFHWRPPLYGYELPPEQRSEFHYLDNEEYMTREFIKYRGNYYDMHEFMVMPDSAEPEFSKWAGYLSDSFFSGLLIRYSEDGEQYQIATYIC